MSVLIFVDNTEGKIKKAALELASYGAALAKQVGENAIALSLGKVESDELQKLGNYGIKKVLTADDIRFASLDNQASAKAIAMAATQTGSKIILLAHNNFGKAVAPRLAVKLQAGLVSNVVGLPISLDPFTVNKHVFTGKAIGHAVIHTPVKVMTLSYNSFGLVENRVNVAVEDFAPDLTNGDFGLTVEQTQTVSGKILLSEAEIVVAGGRGMKGPENWSGLEELASVLGAGMACSRPVSDEGWRPHGEHVGQTGKIIAPNLYFAFGISGAIQHLGGVSGSKVIVAVNKDPEAPIFEAADYGIVGDAMKVLPEMVAAVKELKG